MPHIQPGSVLQHVRQVLEAPVEGRQLDHDLLEEFRSHRDEAAFAALVRRHGRAVLGVGRRVLGNADDAEDVFQATFLVLARKAPSIRRQQSVGSWLYGVAYRLALKAKVSAGRRRQHEARAAEGPAEVTADLAWRELRNILDEELNQLSADLRAPLLLCYLEGKTQDEAARQLGWSLGTFRRRLDRAREVLGHRLTRRGLTLSAALFPAVLAQGATAAVPISLQAATVQAAAAFAAGKGAAAGLVSSQVIHLAEAIMKSMLFVKVKIAAALFLAVALTATGAGLLWSRAAAADSAPLSADRSTPAPQTDPAKTRPAQENPPPAPPSQVQTAAKTANVAAQEDDPPRAAEDFPRRLLAISVHNYPYTTPTSPGTGARSIDRIAQSLGEILRVPEDQITLLSDRAAKPFPPTRTLIERTIQRYLDTSRDQDRIILLFVGHGVEINGKVYLVPLLGEPGDPDTLIPLSWLYDRLEKCKARQKVLILDVCRYDPARGAERGNVEMMGDKFDDMIRKPPKGVQLLSACSGGQYSYEAEKEGDLQVSGGVFLNQIIDLELDGRLRAGLQKPDTSIPVEAFAKYLERRTRAKARVAFKADQTPVLSGAEAANDLKFDPKAEPPPRLKIQLPIDAEFKEGIATRAQLQDMLMVPLAVPPVKAGNKLDLDMLPPYGKAALADYKNDGKKADLRDAVKDAVDVLVKHKNAFQERFPAVPVNPQQKTQYINQIQNQQQSLALVYNALETKYEELTMLKAERDKETKLWQANYDYVQAQLLFRMTQFFEYQVMLGKIRKDELPALEKHHKGYRLASKVKLGDPGAEKLAADARKLLKQIAEQHKGTPWELIAKRELTVALGLEWQPD